MPDAGTLENVFYQPGVEFDWKIKNFTKIRDDTDSVCFSPDFYLCGYPWYLQLHPNGEKEQSEGYIGLSLYFFDLDPPRDVRFSFGIRTTKGKTAMKEIPNVTFDYDEEECLCWYSRVIKRSDLFRLKDELLPLDVLTIKVSLKAKLPPIVPKNVSVQTKVEDIAAKDEKDEPLEKTGTEKVLQDIGKMYPSGDNYDVVFRVGDQEFKAHRAILAARTPVLGAMFRHDTAEKASGEVTIEDCEPAVFEQLLHYIYKGAPCELTAENASSLYVVADKYLVSEVKELCVRCMRDTLGVDTFCRTVTVSLEHKEGELLKTAVQFFSRNMLSVVETVQWQTFLRDHSTWANEILIGALKVGAKRRKRRE